MVAHGGIWTIEKLDRVEKYLRAYLKVMKNQKFRLSYIDAFSGSGEAVLRGSEELALLNEGRKFTEGSARRALQLDPPFDRYDFIDLNKRNLSELKTSVEKDHSHLLDRTRFHDGDVNVKLPEIVSSLSSRDRAVVFLDPFGMQVNWSTLKEIGKLKIDLWYLVPVSAIVRLATKDLSKQDPKWAERLDLFLGDSTWRSRWYGKDNDVPDLFGNTDERFFRKASTKDIEIDFHSRLTIAGFKMADNKLRLKDGSTHLFTLMFGCSNKNKRAQEIAVRIANSLLKE